MNLFIGHTLITTLPSPWIIFGSATGPAASTLVRPRPTTEFGRQGDALDPDELVAVDVTTEYDAVWKTHDDDDTTDWWKKHTTTTKIRLSRLRYVRKLVPERLSKRCRRVRTTVLGHERRIDDCWPSVIFYVYLLLWKIFLNFVYCIIIYH